ncbi:MAG: T9SS type A sorting domain-containing protein [Dysgonamonadaceae bacterium]|jgi:hypothetical protein|nr:T9SS type A sorting domain-containing protein [Dysgonamonadaceae bacterium]
MKKVVFILFLLCAGIMRIYALPGDTVVVQAFSFEDGRQARRDTIEFPDGSVQYEKVLMYYTLRCDPSQYPACGEWDYIFNTEILDSIGVDSNSGDVIYQSWKLGTYITPYGYGINLNTGWTWIYDVSDYVHLLKNKVIIQDGNYQELLDLKFVFTEGTPPRDVIEIKKVWDGEYSLQDFDNIVQDTTIHLTPDEVQVKLRATLTGHGQDNPKNCAEFCPNIHSLQVDGNTIHSWDIIQECANNPLYPQGGTWIFDRAGWCPGMPGTTNEFELTDYVTDNSITFDYDIEPYEYGSYRTFIYLVTYGAINRTDDAAAEMIIAPTDNPLQLRYNPTCGEPIVVIKNLGSNPLNTVDIHYGLNGGSVYTYSWQGDLSFLEKDTVVLPHPDWNEVQGSIGEFWFELLNPNGRVDTTPYNNKLTSPFKMALKIKRNEIRFYFKTNHAPEETTWKLYDINGNLLYENEPDMLADTTYIKDFSLTNGSYRLCLYDSGDDGLYFWFYGEDIPVGSAYLRRPNSFVDIHRFNPDFGRFTQLYFAVNEYSGLETKIDAVHVNDFTIFPNPAHSVLYLDMSNIHGKKLSAEIYDLTGRKVASMPVPQLEVNKIGINHLSSGTYLIVIKERNRQIAKTKFIVD